jgi:transcriptional regulator with XRE-family HTH domain
MSNVLTDEEARKYLAEHLRRLLDEHGVTQCALAKAVKVSNMTVTYWIQGERMAGSGPLARLAEYFGVSTDFLLSKPTRKISRVSA